MALKPPASSSNPREWQGSLPLGGAGGRLRFVLADAKVQHQGWGLQGKVRVFLMAEENFPKCLQKVAPYF